MLGLILFFSLIGAGISYYSLDELKNITKSGFSLITVMKWCFFIQFLLLTHSVFIFLNIKSYNEYLDKISKEMNEELIKK